MEAFVFCRYNREVVKGQRSALARIMEQDMSASLTLLLCVSKLPDAQQLPKQLPGAGKQLDRPVHMELTDGWYCIRATMDKPMIQAMRSGAPSGSQLNVLA
jgi:breast cancer 2 susceptibility protein